MKDYEIVDKIRISYGVGIEFRFGYNGNGPLCRTLQRDDKYDKTITLKVTSWIGSLGAQHFYARLSIPSICAVCLEDNLPYHKKGDEICGFPFPKEAMGVDIEITRPATKEDFNYCMVGEEAGRRKYHKIGKLINGFPTEEEAKKGGIKGFKKLFDKGWVLETEEF